MWSVFTIVTLFIMFKAKRAKLHVNTPRLAWSISISILFMRTFSSLLRLVYRWFLFIYQASYVLGILGYTILLLVFTGISFLFPINPDTVLEAGVTLVFYGVYYGVMGRDCAEVCVDFMAAAMTVRNLHNVFTCS